MHQARGGFGFSPGEPWQFGRWDAVDIDEAFAESEGLRERFWRWMRWPDEPPFTGGVLDAWPAREADGLAFARREWAVIRAYVSQEAKRG